MKVLLADDHDLVRDAIGALLRMDEPDLDLTTAKDLPEALSAVRGVSDYDAVILDLRMPGMNGLVGVQKMIQAVGETPIMIMSGNASKADVQAALKIGVKGFVPKTLTGKSLINALRLVVCGETYVPAAYLSSATAPQSSEGHVSLTDR